MASEREEPTMDERELRKRLRAARRKREGAETARAEAMSTGAELLALARRDFPFKQGTRAGIPMRELCEDFGVTSETAYALIREHEAGHAGTSRRASGKRGKR
jgi:hypothetical protein